MSTPTPSARCAFVDALGNTVIPDVEESPLGGEPLVGWRSPYPNLLAAPLDFVSRADRLKMGSTAREWLAVEIAFEVPPPEVRA